MCPLMCSFTLSVVFICVFMDLPLAACGRVSVCVCVSQGLRGQLQLHCCAPLSPAFLSKLNPSHGISSFCSQLAYSPVMMTPPTMAQSLPDGLMGPQQDVSTHTQTVLLKVSGTPMGTPFTPPKQDAQIFSDEFHEMDSIV